MSNILIPFPQHKIAALIRVSTDPQDMSSQEERLKRFYASKRWEMPPKEWILEEKTSAFRDNALDKRNALNTLVNSCEAGTIKGFVAVRVSRYFRNTGLGRITYERLRKAGSKLIFAEKPDEDIFTPKGYEWFMGELWESERWALDHSARVKDGKRAKASRGETNAAHPGFGARKKRGIIKWTKDALIVRDAITMFHEDKLGRTEIAERLQEKYNRPISRREIYFWLVAPRYYGLTAHAEVSFGQKATTYRQRKEAKLRKARWKPIVPRRWYRENLEILKSRNKRGKSVHPHNEYIFSGLLVCAECGKTLTGMEKIISGGKGKVYSCYGGINGLCPTNTTSVRESSILERIDSAISSIKLPDDWKAKIEDIIRASKANKISKEEEDRNKQSDKKKLAMRFANGEIDAQQFQREVLEIDREKEIHIPSETIARKQAERAVALIENIGILWSKATIGEKKAILRQLYQWIKIDVHTGAIVDVRHEEGMEELIEKSQLVGKETIQDRILAALKESPRTLPEITSALGEPHGRIKSEILLLNRAGKIVKGEWARVRVASGTKRRRRIWKLKDIEIQTSSV